MTTPSFDIRLRWHKSDAQPPIGLCYIAAVLEKSNYDVQILDAFAKCLSPDEIKKEIKLRKPDIIGINLSYSIFYKNAKKLSELIKDVNKNIITVIGGAHLFLNSAQTMAEMPCLDFAIRGEGEYAFLELIKSIDNKTPLSEIKGLVYREGNELKINPGKEWIDDLDELPFPARQLIDMGSKDYGITFRYKRLPATGMVSSRGCPSSCLFCDRVFGRKYRVHSARRVIEEMKHLIKEYGIKEIFFMDDNFLLDINRVKEICKLIKEGNIDITWSCQGRIDTVYNNPEIIPIIKSAGCWYISFGIESGNQSVLNFIHKNITLEQVRKVIDIVHNKGIITKGYFMIGHPIDTKETIIDTINFAKSLKLDAVQFNLTVPYPGTELYGVALKTGQFDAEEYEHLSGHSNTPIYVPNGLTKKDLIELQKKGYKEFYFRPSYFLSQAKNITDLTALKRYSYNGSIYVKKLVLSKLNKMFA